ncbi:MAG TPA: hypothetical protein VJ875_02665 [Pyrinomonadaceae bacterium]|nr:hypothetical protein [Pyrinomonadaceae bacterium]
MRAFFVVAVALVFVLTFFEPGFVSTGVVDITPTAQNSNKNSNRRSNQKPGVKPDSKKPAKKPPVNTNKPGGPQKNTNELELLYR